MSLLFMESFDKYTVSTSPATQLQRFWAVASNTSNINSGGRNGNEFEFTSNETLTSATFAPNPNNEGVLGFAFKVDAVTDDQIVRVREGSTVHLELEILSGGTLRVMRGLSTVLATQAGGPTIGNGIWSYIEFKWDIHDTTGSVVVRINGTEVINATALDTRNGGTGIWDNLQFTGQSGSVDSHFDDLYILDTTSSGVTGAPNNDFLGDVIVEAIFPDGNGATSQLTGQDADSTNNYLNVDENPGPDDDTTYNGSATASDQDTYTMGNLSTITNDDIRAIQVSNVCRTESGTRDIRNIIRHSAVDYYAGARTISSTYDGMTDIAEGANPFSGTTQWTIANINALEAGFEVNT